MHGMISLDSKISDDCGSCKKDRTTSFLRYLYRYDLHVTDGGGRVSS